MLLFVVRSGPKCMKQKQTRRDSEAYMYTLVGGMLLLPLLPAAERVRDARGDLLVCEACTEGYARPIASTPLRAIRSLPLRLLVRPPPVKGRQCALAVLHGARLGEAIEHGLLRCVKAHITLPITHTVSTTQRRQSREGALTSVQKTWLYASSCCLCIFHWYSRVSPPNSLSEYGCVTSVRCSGTASS